jgi:phospholipase/carboxylesterase
MASPITCLPCVQLEPGPPATHSVIWLHGLGADGFDFPPLVPHLGLGDEPAVRFVFPHAPRMAVTINGGAEMPSWYDIRAGDLASRHDIEGVRRSAAELTRLVEREGQRGVPPERIVVAGFSQGGAVAAHMALRHGQRLAGLAMLSTYLATEEGLEDERSEANRSLPIFQAHGTRDPMVRLERGRAARERLTGLGYSVDWSEYPMEHQASLEEARDLGRWLRARLAP